MGLKRCPEGHMFSPRRYGDICPYCNKSVRLGTDTEDIQGDYNDSTPYIGDLEVLNPVTGWIVCIDGPSKGRDYKIFTEKNFVGRADGMDIQILGDNHIAKRNHAVFVYDPKKRKTMILPGDSQGLVYLNDETVYSPQELSAYDTIELGKSKFLFIPLCGENFEWTDVDDADESKAGANGNGAKNGNGNHASLGS